MTLTVRHETPKQQHISVGRCDRHRDGMFRDPGWRGRRAGTFRDPATRVRFGADRCNHSIAHIPRRDVGS